MSKPPLPSQVVDCVVLFVKKMRIIKFFLLVSCTSFAFVILLAKFAIKHKSPAKEGLILEALNNIGRDFRYTNVYRKPSHLPKNLKYILLWTDKRFSPFSFLEDGQRSFLKNNCSVINCYVSTDTNLFGSDYTKFDAVAFNGRTMNTHRLPLHRSSQQMYIYFNMESSDNFPVCDERLDNYFNLTATYRLDSDISLSYVLIRDKNGKIVGPRINMQWTTDMKPIDKDYMTKIKDKSKIAAWFVSNCATRSKREDFVSALNDALLYYGYKIDIYGSCGSLTCSQDEDLDCDVLLNRDYYFYLALENSFAEDYATEKLLTALNHDIVPIVFGGANYSRFLPPGSYIDSRDYTIFQLAATMNRLAHSPKQYSKFFYWKEYYKYSDPSAIENICHVCETLNNNSILQKTYKNFRFWWNPNYRDRCRWFL